MTETLMRVISLGWGVQSFGLAAMSALGVLPRVDAAIFADTGHETLATYEFAARWTPWLEERGVRVVTVTGDFADTTSDEWGGIFIPAYTLAPDGAVGQLRRQCTHRWKIQPFRRYIQRVRNGRRVEVWLGITLDEAERARPAAARSERKTLANRAKANLPPKPGKRPRGRPRKSDS
jgi:3'-phosphoadenosine 5'-phosphosulfate sulfotransferase (PAPS reductase)/FAD synthetase